MTNPSRTTFSETSQTANLEDVSKLTAEAELFYYYFQFLYFGKPHIIPDLNKSSSSAQKRWPYGVDIFLRFGFIFSRFVAYGKFIYFVIQLNGYFNGIHGELEVFDVIEIYLWLLPTFFYVGDFMMYSSGFLDHLDSTLTLCNNVWSKVKDSSTAASAAIRMSLRHKIFRFAKHSLSIDYFQYINIMYSFVGMMEHKTNVYSVLPENLKSHKMEIVFTFLEGMNINWLLVAVSLMTTFPGVLSFMIEELIRGLSVSLIEGDLTKYSAQEIVQDFRNLEFSVRELNKWLGFAVLMFQFAQGAQQVAQTYCIFQLIRAGVEFGDIQMLFLDLIQTASRLYHSFHAMSRVSDASEEFRQCLKNRLSNSKPGSIRLLKAQGRSLKRICMTVGPCECTAGFPLAATSTYMDNYVAAALWPSPQ